MRYLLALFLGFSLFLSACGEREADIANKKASDASREEVAIRLAQASEEAGDLSTAEKMYTQAISQIGGARTRLELAGFYQRHNEQRRAAKIIKEAEKLYPKDVDVMRAVANIYVAENNPEAAVDLLEKAITEKPDDALLYNSRGVAFDMLGKYKEARQDFNTAQKLAPEHTMMLNANLAMSYILTGSYSKAIRLLLPLAQSKESTPAVRQNLALAYGLKGDKENALKFGLKDSSETQMNENIKFYQMINHQAIGGKVVDEEDIKIPQIPSIPPK